MDAPRVRLAAGRARHHPAAQGRPRGRRGGLPRRPRARLVARTPASPCSASRRATSTPRSTLIADAIAHPFDVPSKERPPFGDLRLAPLLDAQAEIAAAAGDVDTARRAADALAAIAERTPAVPRPRVPRWPRPGPALIDGDLGAAAIDGALGGRGAGPTSARRSRPPRREWCSATHTDASGNVDGRAHGVAGSRGRVRVLRCSVRRSGPSALLGRIATRPLVGPRSRRPAGRRSRADGDTVICVRRTSVADARPEGVALRRASARDHRARVPRARPGRGRARLAADPSPTDHDGIADRRGIGAGLPVIDDEARRPIAAAWLDVDEDIEDALACNDIGRAELAQRDRDYLIAELARAVGLGGRLAPSADPPSGPGPA